MFAGNKLMISGAVLALGSKAPPQSRYNSKCYLIRVQGEITVCAA
jgi:hypothetical protein